MDRFLKPNSEARKSWDMELNLKSKMQAGSAHSDFMLNVFTGAGGKP